jgi:hypothetical protein
MIRVIEIRNTCGACPSQWEGRLSDGRFIYVRYRWGYLSIRVGSPDVRAAISGEEVFGQYAGEFMDGWMTYEDLKKHTQGKIEWPDNETDNL